MGIRPDEDPGEAPETTGRRLSLPVHIISRVSETTRVLENEVRGRAHPRYQLGISCYLQLDGLAGQAAATVGDISAGGMMLHAPELAVALGARVRLVLELPFFGSHRICTLSGRVVRLHPAPAPSADVAVAVEFDAQWEAADRRLLRDFLVLWCRPEDPRSQPGHD